MNPRDFVYSNLSQFITDDDSYCRYTLRDTVNSLVMHLRMRGVLVKCDEDPRKTFQGLEVRDDGECYYVWSKVIDQSIVSMYRENGFEMIN